MLSSLHVQTESNQRAYQKLAEQARRGQGATQELARESVGVYLDFLNSMFSYYRQQSATTAAPATGTTGDLEADSTLPIENYDSLNVRQVTQRMTGLSVDEIKRLRDYEIRNKNRRSLVSRMNSKLEAAPS